jgi:uncharacterized protein (TIGR02117 family)
MKRRRWLWVAVVVLGPAAAYLALAVALGAVNVNRGFRPTSPAAGGVPIYLRTNGVHADIVLPTRQQDHDWSRAFPAAQMRALPEPARWIAFGWGDRAFMLETPTWRDIRVGTGVKALLGLGTGAMHVEYVADPRRYDVVEVHVSAAEHARLVDAIETSFSRAADGKPVLIAAPGYFDTDAFYEAVPVYSWRFTCNEWVRTVLSRSGLPAPAWAPFEQALFWHARNATGHRSP